MADTKEKQPTLVDVEQRVTALEAKVAALEEMVIGLISVPTDSVAKAQPKTPLTSETFLVDDVEYRLRYPAFQLNGRKVTQAEVIGNKSLQEEIVRGGFKVVQRVASVLFALLMFLTAQAQTITINNVTAESITLNSKKRDFYAMDDLMFIYRATTEAFEVQVAKTRAKIWGGDIDSVTISGASTAAQKLAKLRLWCFETTTTTGYRSFLPRNNIKWLYTAATGRLEMRHAPNDQVLWFGLIDSLQVTNVSGSSNKLAYLRATANRKFETGILGSGVQATVAAGAALGTSPTVAIVGDAISGEVTFTTGGSTTSTGVLFTVTFPTTAPTGVTTVWSASDADAGGHIARLFGTNPAANTFALNVTGTALTASGTEYKIKYFNAAY